MADSPGLCRVLRPGAEDQGVRDSTFCVRPYLFARAPPNRLWKDTQDTNRSGCGGGKDGAGDLAGLETAFFPEPLEGGLHSL